MPTLPLSLPDRIRLRPGTLRRWPLISAEWTRHFVTQNYEGDWSVIPLRGPRGARHPVMMIYSDPTCREFEDTPFLERCPSIRRVLGFFQCPLLAARLMRLGPGSVIREHRDHDLDFEQGTVRLHIPVTTNDRVAFRLNGQLVTLTAGSCWHLLLSDRHSVRNDGVTDRIHLVLDATVNEWLENELLAACL